MVFIEGFFHTCVLLKETSTMSTKTSQTSSFWAIMLTKILSLPGYYNHLGNFNIFFVNSQDVS
jgi:hypothetical protein